MYRSLTDFRSSRLITVKLISESELRSQIIATADVARTNTPAQIISALNFLEATTRSNSLISALNRNTTTSVFRNNRGFLTVSTIPIYVSSDTLSAETDQLGPPCYLEISTVPAGFYQVAYYENTSHSRLWPVEYPGRWVIPSATVNGFFGACNPLNALLASTLDCLYNSTCLQPFTHYFPRLNQVFIDHITSPDPSIPLMCERISSLLD